VLQLKKGGKMSRTVIPLVSVLLMASLPWAENLTVILQANDYEVIDVRERGQAIRMEEFGSMHEPGKPMLPAKVFLIGLPPGAEVRDVTVEGMGKVELPGSYEIVPSPPPVPTAAQGEKLDEWLTLIRQEWEENYERTYNSDELYPGIAGEYLGSGNVRKYRFARVSYSPFAYNPLSKSLSFYPSARVSIDYVLPLPGGVEAMEAERLLSDRVGEQLVSELLVNYWETKSWYPPTEALEGAQQPYDYVIITDPSLSSAVNSLVTWKTGLGYSVKVVTTDSIQAHYPGVDLQEKIRNFLITKYPTLQWGIEYVLLVGDISLIPMRKCYPDPANHANDVPTDHYYADLTGNWDSDGDSYPGEYGEDNVDIAPEVLVGRIPETDSDTVIKICNKIASFEADSGTWKNSALLMGAILEFPNEDGSGWPGSDGADLHCGMALEFVWPENTLVEAHGLTPSTWWSAPWLRDDSVTYANAIFWWGNGQYGMVNIAGHGNQTSVARKIWSSDVYNPGVPDNPSDFSWPTFFDNAACAQLNDNYPSIVFSIGCDNGYPGLVNLGRRLLRRGGSAVIASTRFCYHLQGWWGVPQGGSFTLNHMFSRYMLLNDAEVGRALYWGKVFYSNNYLYPGWEWTDYQNVYDFCLYGDPSMRRFPIPRPRVVATSPVAHSPSVSSVTNIQATFDKDVLSATIDTGRYGSFFVWGSQSGPRYQGNMQYVGGTRTATFTPANLPFFSGEKVITTLTEGILSTDSASLDRYAFSFTVEASHLTNADFDSTASFHVGGWAGVLGGADFNQDGFVDLIVLDGNTPSDSVSVLRNLGDGNFLPTGKYALGSHPTSICIIDADRDGDLDPVVACDTMLVVLGNDGLGNFPFPFYYSWGWGAGSSLRHLGSHELGGRWTILDFALTFGGNDVGVLLYKDLANGYGRYDYYDLPGGPVADLWLDDIDSDGEVDIIGSMSPYVLPADSLWIMFNEGSGTFSTPTLLYAGFGAEGIYGNDFNGDGWVDLATACIWDASVSVLMNDGAGGLQSPVRYPISLASYHDGPHHVEGADFDGDGDIDLVAYDIYTGVTMIDSLYLFMNNGNGTFTGPTAHATAAAPRDVFCADLDSDQDIDIAVSLGNHPPNPVQILWNTSGGAQCGDCNGDGFVNFADALYVKNYYYQTPPGSPAPIGQGDVNLDGFVNFADALYIKNYYYQTPPGSPPPCNPTLDYAPRKDEKRRIR